MNLALILGRPLIVTLMGLPLYLFGKTMTKETLLPFAVGELLGAVQNRSQDKSLQ
jgi:hypothetical protein